MRVRRLPGFTIVELLIVIVVIAILASITIVAFNGIQNRATQSGVQTDLRNALTKVQEYYVLNGFYPAQSDVGLTPANISASKSLYDTNTGNFLYCGTTSSAHAGFAAQGKDGTVYAISTNMPLQVYTTNPLSNYSTLCGDIAGTSGARYGYSGGWRPWVFGN